MEKINCNLCGENDYEIIREAQYDKEEQTDLKEKYRSSGDEVLIDQVVKCKKCGFVYINPRLEPEKILEGYSEGEDPTFVSQAKGRELTFKKSLKLINKYHPEKGRILDIGTAGGSFLKVAKEDGWKVNGCEPNKWMCKWAAENYYIDIKPGDLKTQAYPEQNFNVVCMWDVLEHTSDPQSELKECNRILKPEGLFVINYPDYKSLIARMLGKKWMFWLSVHLFYFDRNTIRKALEQNGFEIVKIKPHIQRLQLGYLVLRMKQYSKILNKIGTLFLKIIPAKNWLIPYWLGQTLVIAKKKNETKNTQEEKDSKLQPDNS